MKKKIIFATLFCALSAGVAVAQIGVNFGYSRSSIKDDVKGSYHGFNAGVSYDLTISENWTMLTGLNYSRFNRTFDTALGLGILHNTYTFQYLELPIQPAYNMQLTDDFKLFGFVGPKLVCGLSGKHARQQDGQPTPANINLYDKGQDRSRFNAKLGFGIGAQYLNLRLKMGYDWGLLNQYTGIGDKKYNRNEFYITAGYIIK